MRITIKNFNETVVIVLRFLTKKEFGIYRGLSCRRAVARHWNSYLFAVGKPASAVLTNVDVYKIDQIQI